MHILPPSSSSSSRHRRHDLWHEKDAGMNTCRCLLDSPKQHTHISTSKFPKKLHCPTFRAQLSEMKTLKTLNAPIVILFTLSHGNILNTIVVTHRCLQIQSIVVYTSHRETITTLNTTFSVTCYLGLSNNMFVCYISHILPSSVKLVV